MKKIISYSPKIRLSNKSTKFSRIIKAKYIWLVLSFAFFAVVGFGIITNNHQSSIGSSFASAQEPADINNDSKVDIFDLSTLLSKWNSTDNLSDINKDGVINIFDLSILLSRWGVVSSTSPETNLARITTPQVTTIASSQDIGAGQGVDNIIDGNLNGYPVDDSGEWSSVGGRAGSWAQLSWASPVTINRIVLYDRPNTDDQITGGNLTFSDGSIVTVPSLANDGTAVTVTFEARTVNSVRLNITSVSSTTVNIGLAELEAWGIVDNSINYPPIANAGADQTVIINNQVTLNGTNSTDPNGNPLNYTWTFVSGPTVTLSSANTASPKFTPTVAGTYIFSLIVNDGLVSSSVDTVTIYAINQSQSVTLTSQDLQLVNTKRILFGHQSVGGNIMDLGIPGVYGSYGVVEPRRLDWQDINRTSGGFLSDFFVGQNEQPLSKIGDFNNTVRSVNGQIDFAFFKFCFVDIVSSTNITQVFTSYRDTMNSLQTIYPNVKFIYTTAVLDEYNVSDAIKREQFNAMIRAEYGSTGRLFDIAKIESTRPDGTRVSGISNGQTYYQLYNGYSTDGGHLNSQGASTVTKELLLLLANLSR